jgi:hypothetical protein
MVGEWPVQWKGQVAPTEEERHLSACFQKREQWLMRWRGFQTWCTHPVSVPPVPRQRVVVRSSHWSVGHLLELQRNRHGQPPVLHHVVQPSRRMEHLLSALRPAALLLQGDPQEVLHLAADHVGALFAFFGKKRLKTCGGDAANSWCDELPQRRRLPQSH